MELKEDDAKIRDLVFRLEMLRVSIDASAPTAMTCRGKDPPPGTHIQCEERNDEILRLQFDSDSSSSSSVIQGEVLEEFLQDVKYPTSNHCSFPPTAESQSGDLPNINLGEWRSSCLNVPQRDKIPNLDYSLDISSSESTSLLEIGNLESQNDESLNSSPSEPIADVDIEVTLDSALSCDYTKEENSPRTEGLDLSENDNESDLSPINAARPQVEKHAAELMEIDTTYNNTRTIHNEKIVGLHSYERVSTPTPVPSTRLLEPEERVIGGRPRPSYASIVRNEGGGGGGGGVWSNRRSQRPHSKPLTNAGRPGRQSEATERLKTDPAALPVPQDYSKTSKMPVKKKEGLENLGPSVRQPIDTELEMGRKLRTMRPKRSWPPIVSSKSNASHLKERPVVLTEKVKPPLKRPEEPVQDLRKRTTKSRACPPISDPSREKVTSNIVIIFDDSKPMAKFFSPFVDNMKTLWDLLSHSDKEFHISLITPGRSFDFTSDRAQFLSFVESIEVDRSTPHDTGNGDQCSTTGLAGALSRLDEVRWDASSKNFVYVFTNMSACGDKDDDSRDMELCRSIRRMKACLPTDSKLHIGCWLQDNDLLLRTLKSQRIFYLEFGILDVQMMASHIANDIDLTKARYKSKVPEKTATSITICDGPKGKSALKWFRGAKQQGSVDCRANMFQVVPLKSIQEVNTKAGFKSQPRWMKRESKPVQVTNGVVHYAGQLRHQHGGEYKDFIFKSLKIDAITYGSSVTSQGQYKGQAFVSAVAQFLASQYNKDHRPEHCSKIEFLHGYIVEENPSIDGKKRVFYAEPRLKNVPQRVYCDGSGAWSDPAPDESLLRFAQMCFKLSGGDFMLAGLRGDYRLGRNSFVLSAPTLLHRAFADEHSNACNKEYMKVYRKETKESARATSLFSPIPRSYAEITLASVVPISESISSRSV